MMENHYISIVAIVAISGLFFIITPQDAGMMNTPLVGMGQSLGEKLPAVTEQPITFMGGRNTRYSQSIVFSRPGLFTGGVAEYAQDEYGRTGDALVFKDNLFLYTMDFDEGLYSPLKDKTLYRLAGKYLPILGERFLIQNVTYNKGTNEVRMLLQGENLLDFTDVIDDHFSRGVRINGSRMDALVRIRATSNNDEVTIYSVEYLPEARPAKGTYVYVPAGEGLRQYLRQPEVLLVKDFDIVYGGVGTQSSPLLTFEPVNQGYNVAFVNQQGKKYTIGLVYNDHGVLRYGKRNRALHYQEGQPIKREDYIVLTTKDSISGITNIFQYRGKLRESIVFQDLAGGQKIVPYKNNKGWLRVNGAEYLFTVSGNTILVDLNRDGIIGTTKMPIILKTGTKLDLGSAGSTTTVTYTAPASFAESRTPESITFTFSVEGTRVIADTNMATFTNEFNEDVGMMNAGHKIVVHKDQNPPKITITGSPEQANAVISVG